MQNLWQLLRGDMRRMYEAMVRMAHSPLLISRWWRRLVLEVLPSMTAIKSLVATSPSSLFFTGLFGVRFCSIIVMLEIGV